MPREREDMDMEQKQWERQVWEGAFHVPRRWPTPARIALLLVRDFLTLWGILEVLDRVGFW